MSPLKDFAWLLESVFFLETFTPPTNAPLPGALLKLAE
jgi:hypothetical protein